MIKRTRSSVIIAVDSTTASTIWSSSAVLPVMIMKADVSGFAHSAWNHALVNVRCASVPVPLILGARAPEVKRKL